jgi:hypothetical protein
VHDDHRRKPDTNGTHSARFVSDFDDKRASDRPIGRTVGFVTILEPVLQFGDCSNVGGANT